MEVVLNNSIQEKILMSIEEKNNFNFNTLENFLIGYKNFKVGSNSYITYKTHIKKVYDHYMRKNCYTTEVDMLKKIDIDSIEKFFIELKMSGKYKPSTFNLIRSANYEYFKFLKDNKHLITVNPIDVVGIYSLGDIEESKKEKEILTVSEMQKLLKAVNVRKKGQRNFKFNSARDTFLYALLFTTGLRISEALSIRLNWIENTNNGIMINIPKKIVKNNIDKRVPLVGSIVRYYQDYMRERDGIEEKIEDKKLLFLSSNGKRLNITDINDGLRKNIDKAKIDKHLSCHSFRHSLTRKLIIDGVDDSIIYKILGWSQKGIISNYSGTASDKIYDELKHEVCNIL